MKLIKCHIENFGKLHDFDYTFSSGLNSIKEENGWGKSTFATFIKSMFYGLPSNSKHNLDENERKKFSPWQGGNFGGNITFEINGKQYRLERFFGKNNSEDTFELVDEGTGKRSKDFSSTIGEEIFGIDEGAFERSLFIPQKILNSNINESISNKLTKLIQGTTEEYNLEQATKALDKKRVALFNTKGTGEIQKLENKRDEILAQINELNEKGATIPDIQKHVDEEEEQISELIERQDKIKAQIKEYSVIQEKIAHKAMFEKLKKQLDSTEEELSKRQRILNGQNTSIVEIDAFISKSKEIDKNESKLKSFENSYAKERYEYLTKYFGDSIPSVQETKVIGEDISRLNTLNSQEMPKPQEKAANGGKKKICLTLALLSILCLIVGVCTIKPMLILSVAMFVLGVLLLLGAGFIYLTNMINQKTASNQIDYQKVQKDREEATELKGKIEEFLSRYEKAYVDYSAAFNKIISSQNELINIQNQLDIEKQESEELLKVLNVNKDDEKNFILKFAIEENGSDYDKLVFLKQTLIEISKLKEIKKDQESELEKFKKERNFDEENEVEGVDINGLQSAEKELQNQIDEKREMRTKYISTIGKIQDDIAILDDLENEKENLENSISQLKEELNAVTNAKTFLEIASESLSSKFLDPMKKGLNKYLKLITNKDFENLKLDTDFNISFEEYGKLRDVDYYSKGYKNTIDLSMRLALIDALFDKERPFIVLDDPFVNLDENKVENAKEFLKELAKTYQLIYFSCHSSRC